jgi:prepilin-type N-terminal cleavage/methylation domain-containing protein
VSKKVSNLLKKDKGFTLIEIVLVLAIAGLLLVIVFLAVSGAQKSRRDSQRKNDLSRVAAQLESFAGNNNGCYPGMAGQAGCPATTQTLAQFWASTYITGANLNDPSSGTQYGTPGAWNAAPVFPNGGPAILTYRTAAACDNTALGRGYSVNMALEQGVVCRDNK